MVEFPADYAPPRQGSVVSQDEARPYGITGGAQTGRWAAQCLCAGNHAGELVAAGVQDYFAVADFSARHAILVGIFDHVTSQRLSDSE